MDDGSTDASTAILDEYAAKDPRFRVIKREHTNAGACRNAGMDMAKGEFLSFLDADDVFASRMLTIMKKIADEKKADIVICKSRDFSKDELTDSFFPLGNNDFRLLSISSPAHTIDIFSRWMGWAWDKLFRREQVARYGFTFQETPANNDLSFVFSMLSVAKGIVEVQVPLVAHRKHAQSIEGKVGYKNPWCVCEALTHYYRQMNKIGILKENSELLKNYLNYAICFSTGRMCVSKTYEEFSLVQKSFFSLLEVLNIKQYDSAWFSSNRDLYEWCLKYMNEDADYSALRALLLTLFSSRNKAKKELQRVSESKAYKIARYVTKIWLKVSSTIRS